MPGNVLAKVVCPVIRGGTRIAHPSFLQDTPRTDVQCESVPPRGRHFVPETAGAASWTARDGTIQAMDHIVAVRAQTDAGQVGFWLTWGRLFGSVEPSAMIAAIRPHLRLAEQRGEV
jgi:hypothetical protein